jgi:CTP synthase
MRLGAWKCEIIQNSLAYKIYQKTTIMERHRHRYEFNGAYLDALQNAGLKASGINPETGLVEIVEIENHPYFIGVQYHPEYKSTVAMPHPLFVNFIAAAVKNKKN